MSKFEIFRSHLQSIQSTETIILPHILQLNRFCDHNFHQICLLPHSSAFSSSIHYLMSFGSSCSFAAIRPRFPGFHELDMGALPRSFSTCLLRTIASAVSPLFNAIPDPARPCPIALLVLLLNVPAPRPLYELETLSSLSLARCFKSFSTFSFSSLSSEEEVSRIGGGEFGGLETCERATRILLDEFDELERCRAAEVGVGGGAG